MTLSNPSRLRRDRVSKSGEILQLGVKYVTKEFGRNFECYSLLCISLLQVVSVGSNLHPVDAARSAKPENRHEILGLETSFITKETLSYE